MSNYYKYINSTSVPLSTIVKYCKTAQNLTSVQTSFNNFTGVSTVESIFTSGSVNETPSDLGYQINGTDISSFFIANFSDYTTSTSIQIPSWCTKIRFILIGGGGNGGTGGAGTNYWNVVSSNANSQLNIQYYNSDFVYGPYVGYNSNIHGYYKGNPVNIDGGVYPASDQYANLLGKGREFASYYEERGYIYRANGQLASSYTAYNGNNQQTAGGGGGGGGSGGFYYLEVQGINPSSTFNITIGGVGQASSLQYGSTVTVAGGNNGNNGNNATVGAGGTSGAILGTSINITNTNSGSGGGRNGGAGGISVLNKCSLLTYGNGGVGGVGAAGGVANGSGNTSYAGSSNPGAVDSTGTGGFCRIYFLTN